MIRHKGCNFAQNLIEGELKHELGIHPAQRLIRMQLPIGLQFTTVEAEVATDRQLTPRHQRIGVSPLAGDFMTLHHSKEQDRSPMAGTSDAMAAMQMGDAEMMTGGPHSDLICFSLIIFTHD
jgi:hypothetical protein